MPLLRIYIDELAERDTQRDADPVEAFQRRIRPPCLDPGHIRFLEVAPVGQFLLADPFPDPELADTLADPKKKLPFVHYFFVIICDNKEKDIYLGFGYHK